MAQECPAAIHSPDEVGNTFVGQYYSILHASPEQVHRFYQDSSCLSRPGPDGVMTSVTTMQGINEMFLSLDYHNYHAEILTADSQYSHQNGLMVLVTGFLSREDTIKRKFTQTFFLAPQNNGFFVLNDIFRYVDDHESAVIAKNDHESDIVYDYSAKEEIHSADPVHDSETSQIIDQSAEDHTSILEKSIDNGDQTNHQAENGEMPVAEKEIEIEIEIVGPQCSSTPNDVLPVADKTFPADKQEAQKKSYASMAKALKENPAPFHTKVPPKLSQPLRPAPAPEASVPVSAPVSAPAPSRNKSTERNNDHSAEGHSIFIRNLPFDATAEQLEAIFKTFGSIKPNGIQVRGFKDQQSCFGFVEFESPSSVMSALQASPISIGNRNATVEMKRRENNDGGRFRGGYRNDNFRPRGGYGGRGYGRHDFERRGDYSGRGRGNDGRSSSNGNGNSYPRERGVYQN